MSVMTAMRARLQLADLPMETWGERLRRARELSGLRLDEAAETISRVWPVSYASLVRLEKERKLPANPRRRLVAFLALVAYGFEPAGFEVGDDVLPAALSRERVLQVLRTGGGDRKRTASPSKPSGRWTREWAGHSTVVDLFGSRSPSRSATG